MTPPTLSTGELGTQGFGAMRLDPMTTGEPDRDPATVIDAVLDAGVRMIDTADAYGNEELVGRSIGSRRDEVILASKFGLQWHDGVAGGFTVRADPAYVRQACAASLRRLGTDVIDLYYLHHRSDTTPIEDTIDAMAGLVDAGKVRALGLSNVTADDLRRAHAVHRITALQEKWSLTDRRVEETLLPAAIELGVAIVAHSPTSHGALHQGFPAHHGTSHEDSPTLADARASHGAPYQNPPGSGPGPPGSGAVLARIASRLGVTPGQVALAWVHHRETVHGLRVIPLPGTTRARHARANVAAAGLQLSDTDLRRLDESRPEPAL